MVEVKIFKAGQLGSKEIESLTIAMDESMDSETVSQMNSAQLREFYDAQGEILCDTLFSTLPGGTVDSLICSMMRKRASLFRVRFKD